MISQKLLWTAAPYLTTMRCSCRLQCCCYPCVCYWGFLQSICLYQLHYQAPTTTIRRPLASMLYHFLLFLHVLLLLLLLVWNVNSHTDWHRVITFLLWGSCRECSLCHFAVDSQQLAISTYCSVSHVSLNHTVITIMHHRIWCILAFPVSFSYTLVPARVWCAFWCTATVHVLLLLLLLLLLPLMLLRNCYVYI